ncbi:response regulator [Azospirillum sp. A26]|uniref:hybrid sensor histidine kinase/response regulator n=1 Tax=Azospirillum sp. A26 TaxID=3160607 RepID=UPI00366FBF23
MPYSHVNTQRAGHSLSKRLIRKAGLTATVLMLAVFGVAHWVGTDMLDRISGARDEALAHEVAARVAVLRAQSIQKIDVLGAALAARHETPSLGDGALDALLKHSFDSMPELGRLWIVGRPLEPGAMPSLAELRGMARLLARNGAGNGQPAGLGEADHDLMRRAVETGRIQSGAAQTTESEPFSEKLATVVMPVVVGHEVAGVIGYDARMGIWIRIGEQIEPRIQPSGTDLTILSRNGTYLFNRDRSLLGKPLSAGSGDEGAVSSQEAEALRSGTAFSHLRMGASGKAVRRVGIPVPNMTGEYRHYVMLDAPLPVMALLDVRIALFGLFCIASLTVFLFLLGRMVRRMVGFPLEQIRIGIQLLDQGRDEVTPPAALLERTDQIGDIVRVMEALRRSQGERRELREMVIRNARDVERMISAIDAALDMIVVLDIDQTVIYANQAACSLMGAPDPDALLGHRLSALEDPNTTLRRAELRLTDVLESNGFWEGQFEDYRTVFGACVPAMEVRFTRRPNGDIVVIGRDVSARQAAAREKADLEHRLSQQDKMDAVGRLAGGIAHDFNNLLGAMTGYADFLLSDLPAGSPQRDYADRIRRVCNRAKDMVQQILAFSRSGEAVLANTKPARVLSDVSILLRTSIPSTVSLRVDAVDDLPDIRANATQLVQVLVNLAINARDALPEETGRISVSAGVWTGEGDPAFDCGPGWATYKALPPAAGQRHVMFEVADNGSGMNEEVIVKAFNPFYTTKEQGKGTGLGLAVVIGIVKAHGGGLVVCSRLHTGTALRVFIPVGDAATPAVEEVELVDLPQLRAKRRCRILVVDDEGDMGDMVSVGLERIGHEVAVCEDPQDAIDAFDEDPDAFHLVIIDQTMPGISGVALIRLLKAKRPDLPCILYTGYSRLVDQAAATAAGADAFFQKPVQMSVLAETVERLLDDASGASSDCGEAMPPVTV